VRHRNTGCIAVLACDERLTSRFSHLAAAKFAALGMIDTDIFVKRPVLAMKVLGSVIAILLLGLGAVTLYVARPSGPALPLPLPLQAFDPRAAEEGRAYWADFRFLQKGFTPQLYRSFCGPATLTTVLQAYGAKVDQRYLFPTLTSKVKAFYTGMSLADIGELAAHNGLANRVIYADRLTAASFRTLLTDNLAREGDYVVVNYDRRVLNQRGAGHISAVGAYDAELDRVLVMDEASYRYPFTWVPLPLLFDAIHTHAVRHYRGVLLITGPVQS
jgi:hypothetical protein